MVPRTVVIASSVGFHVHPAALLAETVDNSDIDVTIAFDGEEADTASLPETMTFGAGHGDEVTLSTDDDNASAILSSLVGLLSRDPDRE